MWVERGRWKDEFRFLRLWALFTALEVLLVGKLDPQETPVGAVVGALAAFGTVCVLRASGEAYRFRWRWLAIVPRLVLGVGRDTLRVFGLLLRRLAGGPLPDDRIVEIPFDCGGDDPESTRAGRWPSRPCRARRTRSC